MYTWLKKTDIKAHVQPVAAIKLVPIFPRFVIQTGRENPEYVIRSVWI